MKTYKLLTRRFNGRIGLVLCLLVLVAAVVGILWTPHDPMAPNFRNRLEGPSLQFLLGTDAFGRDLLSRILAGASVSMLVCFMTVVLAVSCGVVLGAVSGYAGGTVDRLTMMVIEALSAFPGLLLALALMVVLGPSKWGVILALGLAYLPSVTRLVRGTVLSVREKEYVEASVAIGNGWFYTLIHHILPNCIAPLIVLGTTMLGWVLLAESALSFLGLGVPPPAPTWGNMLAEARGELTRFPWLGILPGLCISITLIGVNLLGDALRDVLDPRNRNL
ncbi:ABC transporter permease [Pseudooceanicola nanhaiensis]|uniref:ABC transporter permease n=1 Tax=Pseudooceanicola nanhaiensis TaxID=375761 RepID=UPI001CD4754C|nr:ABC transporter permease [Pseudooceanicola nanhaiensis]MCA0921419.1 ABC transporter permease [Pseudooceanicola nanhaiensis]